VKKNSALVEQGEIVSVNGKIYKNKIEAINAVEAWVPMELT
jgi:hypothetical protein